MAKKTKKTKPRKRPNGGPVTMLPTLLSGVTSQGAAPGIASSPMDIDTDPNLLARAMEFLRSSQGQAVLGVGSQVASGVAAQDPASDTSVFGSAAGAAMKGAQLGSFLGPWGTAIGAAGGGLFGLATGKDRQAKALQSEHDAYLQMIKDKTVPGRSYPFGGVVAKGGDGPGGYVEIQTEEGEMQLLPNFELIRTKAKGKHKDMPEGFVSDKTPRGTFIFSNRTMVDPFSFIDDVLAEGVPFLKEGHENPELGKARMSDVLPDKEMTFAEAAEIIGKKIKITNQPTDIMAEQTDRDNRETRMMYLTRLVLEHESKRPAPTVEELEPEMEEFALGGLVGGMGFQDPLGRIPGLENVIQPAINNSSAYVSSGLLSDPKTAPGFLGALERNIPEIFNRITYRNSESDALDLREITPQDFRAMDALVDRQRNAALNPGANGVVTPLAGTRGPGQVTPSGYPPLPSSGQPNGSSGHKPLPPPPPIVGEVVEAKRAENLAGRREGFPEQQIAGSTIDELTARYKGVYENFLAENDANFTRSNAESDKLTRDLNFANALSGVAGFAGILGQDPSVDPAFMEGTTEQFNATPQSQIDGITNKLKTSRDNIVRDLIASGVPPGQAVTQAAGIIDRTMGQEGDVRTKFAMEQQEKANQRYAFLDKLRNHNKAQEVAAGNAERDNRNKQVSALADITQNAINEDTRIRKADLDRRRQLMREKFINKYAAMEGQYGVEMSGYKAKLYEEDLAIKNGILQEQMEALREDYRLRREADERRRAEESTAQ